MPPGPAFPKAIFPRCRPNHSTPFFCIYIASCIHILRMSGLWVHPILARPPPQVSSKTIRDIWTRRTWANITSGLPGAGPVGAPSPSLSTSAHLCPELQAAEAETQTPGCFLQCQTRISRGRRSRISPSRFARGDKSRPRTSGTRHPNDGGSSLRRLAAMKRGPVAPAESRFRPCGLREVSSRRLPSS